MPLSFASEGEENIIKQVGGKAEVRAHLENLGFVAGAAVKVITSMGGNKLIQRIEVHNNDKSSGHCYVKVDIYFTAVGMIEIPDEKEISEIISKIQESPQMYKVV